MLRRRLASLYCLSSSINHPLSTRAGLFTSSEQAAGSGKRGNLRRKVIPIVLLSLTGGVCLSAVNDLAIFHGCTSKAIEKASQNQKVREAIGEPIVRGPWYDATLAVGHRRNSVSCTFPVSGPFGSGKFQLKAVRVGDNSGFSFLRHHDWDILVLEALLDAPSSDGKGHALRISVMDDSTPRNPPIPCKECNIANSRPTQS